MIVVPGNVESVFNTFQLTETEKQIIMTKERSTAQYRYPSVQELVFELRTRTRIMTAAASLYQSGAQFEVYEKSRCNESYWTRTANGGFLLKPNAAPSAAIRDIFVNGRLYAFECATAIVIVLYKAVLESINENSFNSLFTFLFLRDWQYDSDLRLKITNNPQESYPGDILYVRNPDVDPQTPQWQGENAVKMADNLYYGHGIGITTLGDIIARLNLNRRPGAVRSAYLTDLVVSPDYSYLFGFARNDLVRDKSIASYKGFFGSRPF